MVWDRVGDKVGDRVGREVRRKPYLESVGVVFFFLWSFLNTKVFADITCFCIPFRRDARVRPHLTTAPPADRVYAVEGDGEASKHLS